MFAAYMCESEFHKKVNDICVGKKNGKKSSLLFKNLFSSNINVIFVRVKMKWQTGSCFSRKQTDRIIKAHVYFVYKRNFFNKKRTTLL
jgi:hypothetical protein